jgi:hypothetical protein
MARRVGVKGTSSALFEMGCSPAKAILAAPVVEDAEALFRRRAPESWAIHRFMNCLVADILPGARYWTYTHGERGDVRASASGEYTVPSAARPGVQPLWWAVVQAYGIGDTKARILPEYFDRLCLMLEELLVGTPIQSANVWVADWRHGRNAHFFNKRDVPLVDAGVLDAARQFDTAMYSRTYPRRPVERQTLATWLSSVGVSVTPAMCRIDAAITVAVARIESPQTPVAIAATVALVAPAEAPASVRATGHAVGAESCVVCLELPPSVAFLPCRHMRTCAACAPILTDCPVCRRAIEQQMQLYV